MYYKIDFFCLQSSLPHHQSMFSDTQVWDTDTTDGQSLASMIRDSLLGLISKSSFLMNFVAYGFMQCFSFSDKHLV